MNTLKKGYLTVMRAISKIELFVSSAILAMLIVVWIVFLAGSAAFASKAHVAIEMVVELLPLKVQKGFDILIGITVILVLLFVINTSMAYMEVFIRSGRTTPILKIPYVWIYGIVPVSCVFMVFEYFHSLV